MTMVTSYHRAMQWPAWATDVSTGVVALAMSALVLLLVGIVTSRRPAAPVPPLGGYFDRWQTVHGGYDPRTGSVWVRAWLSGVYRLASPLARRGVRPDVLTASTVWLALAVVLAASEGGRWAMAAGWLVVLSGIGDSLDGAVAVLSDRATQWGYVIDSVVDRVNDVLYVVAVVLVGGSAALGVVCALAFFLLEYLRARAGNAGGGEIAAVTVGERPNRVALCAVGLYFAGVFVDAPAPIATSALGALTGLTVIGLVQLGIAVRRQLA